MSEVLDCLLEALPVIARNIDGFATVTDLQGIRIKTFDSKGNELKDLQGSLFELACHAGHSGSVKTGPSQIIENAEAWAVPIGDFVLAASNWERIAYEQQLENALIQSLPFIARVAGGEAVVFNKEGERIDCIDFDGQRKVNFVGRVSNAAKEAMTNGRPVIGESMSAIGAMGVRIPITKKFGFGFNNAHGVNKQRKLMEEVKKFQYARYNFDDIVGSSDAIQKVKSIAAYVATGVSSILIFGETGTGKELFAQSIHNRSERRSKPFVAINCGALPASIIESYLFGYEEGAFTGAKKQGSPGAFEQAQNGTIFLDELSEMDINLQSKLLRVLQEREVTRIGGTKSIRVDVRVIASTNRDLNEMIANQRFRQDLYYRINVVQLKIPPLRERLEDISPLSKLFINRFNHLLGKFVTGISREAMDKLYQHKWPGNVREVQNCVEHAMNMIGINEKIIETEHLPQYFHNDTKQGSREYTGTLAEAVRNAEKEAIKNTLLFTHSSKKEAAKLLGISTTTLWRKIVELGLEQQNHSNSPTNAFQL